MKRCPECYETYEDQERFCEADGHELLADPTFSPKPEPETRVSPTKMVWWPAIALGVLIGVVIGAGIYVPLSLLRSDADEPKTNRQNFEARDSALPNRAVVSTKAPTPEPLESPSPEAEEQADASPSPAATTENKTTTVQLNQGPISTGEKIKPSENEAGAQTVIEMTDGSTLDVDAAWEDKQGIWYRRSGLVSFVESSRVKAITARRGTKAADAPQR